VPEAFFKLFLRLGIGFRVLRTRLDLAPALAMEGTINDRVVDRAAKFSFVRLPQWGGPADFPLARFFQKGSEQCLFFFRREMGVVTSAWWLIA
jgi:hypothetical protein